MKRCWHLILFPTIMLFCLVFSGSAFSVPTSKKELIIDKVKFGRIYEGRDDEPVFEETDRIPRKVGTPYGWFIHVDTEKTHVTWKEEFTLPTPAVIWGTEEDIQVSGDGKTAITERTVTPENGWIWNWWEVAEGDPSGKYLIRIYVEDQFVKEFVFFVE